MKSVDLDAVSAWPASPARERAAGGMHGIIDPAIVPGCVWCSSHDVLKRLPIAHLDEYLATLGALDTMRREPNLLVRLNLVT
jgi:hypothetical protein